MGGMGNGSVGKLEVLTHRILLSTLDLSVSLGWQPNNRLGVYQPLTYLCCV